MYDLAKGETISQILRRFYLAAVVSEDKTAGAQLAAREKEMVDNLDKIKEMSQALQSQNYQKVLDIYNTLPHSVQVNKTVLFVRIAASQQLPEAQIAEYDNAVADFEKAYPNDPALDLLALDHLYRGGQFEKAHQALDRLTAYTGGDAHLDSQQGQIYLGAGTPADLVKAAEEYKKAITRRTEQQRRVLGADHRLSDPEGQRKDRRRADGNSEEAASENGRSNQSRHLRQFCEVTGVQAMAGGAEDRG